MAIDYVKINIIISNCLVNPARAKHIWKELQPLCYVCGRPVNVKDFRIHILDNNTDNSIHKLIDKLRSITGDILRYEICRYILLYPLKDYLANKIWINIMKLFPDELGSIYKHIEYFFSKYNQRITCLKSIYYEKRDR